MADRRLIKKCLRSPTMWMAASLYAIRRWMGQERINIRRQGLTLCVGSQSGQGAWQAIAGLDYEPELRQILARINVGDVIMDLGANIGSYTLRFAQKTGPMGRVVSIEAMEGNAQFLRRSIELNRLTNVTLVQSAVGAIHSQVSLYSSGHSSSARLKKGGDFNPIGETQMTTGDRIVENLQLTRLDWIKMDIEGSEPDALRGLTQTAARFRPRILFENGPSGQETIGILKKSDYTIGYFDDLDDFIEISDSSARGNLFAVPDEKRDLFEQKKNI